MTRDESTKICYVIQQAYPEQYRDFDRQATETMIDLWAMMLEGYSYEQANAGLRMFMRSDIKGFPPKPGQVIHQIEKLKPQDESQMTEAQAWAVIYKAITNSSYNAQEEFDRLPDVLKRAAGSPTNLREWAMMDEESLSVIESNVMRSYRAAAKTAQEEKLIPESIRVMIGTMFNSQIEQKEANNDGIRKEERGIPACVGE